MEMQKKHVNQGHKFDALTAFDKNSLSDNSELCSFDCWSFNFSWEVIDQLNPKKCVWTFELHNTKHKIQRVMKWTYDDEIQSKINSVRWVGRKWFAKVYNTIFGLDWLHGRVKVLTVLVPTLWPENMIRRTGQERGVHPIYANNPI